MFTQTYRPRTFSDVLGSSYSVRVLRSIAKNPERSPRSIVLSGPPGSGKTSCARILPKALNCKKKQGDSCCKCPSCVDIEEGNGLYVEYDCTHTGNVDDMREITDSFSYSFMEGYRVVTFDEIHMSSNTAQESLLKSLEEAPKDVFFVLCTTEPSKLLRTLKSRSIELSFDPVCEQDIISILSETSKKENLVFTPQVFETIAKRTRGDARNSLHLLEECSIIGEEEFLQHNILLDNLLMKLFESSTTRSSQDYHRGLVNEIMRSPVEFIRLDMERFISVLSDKVFVEKEISLQKMTPLITEWLRMQRYLGGTYDWITFFNGLRKYSTESGGFTGGSDSRFVRLD